MRRKGLWFLIAVPLLLVVGYLIIITAGMSVMVMNDKRRIDDRQRVLLYHTDHAAILAACRQFMRQHPEKANVSVIDMDGNDPRLPLIIRQLHPSFVRVSGGDMMVGFGGGFFHYEFDAFAPGVPGNGGIEVIPGLWYSNEDGKMP